MTDAQAETSALSQGTFRDLGLTFLVRWFSAFPGAAATTTTAATSVSATRIATTRALTRTGTMARALAPDDKKSAARLCTGSRQTGREGFVPFRAEMPGQ